MLRPTIHKPFTQSNWPSQTCFWFTQIRALVIFLYTGQMNWPTSHVTLQFVSSSARLQSAIPSHSHVFCNMIKLQILFSQRIPWSDFVCWNTKKQKEVFWILCLPKCIDHLCIEIHLQHKNASLVFHHPICSSFHHRLNHNLIDFFCWKINGIIW